MWKARQCVIAGGFLLLAGCGLVLGLDPPTYDGPIPSGEAGAPDVFVPEAAAPNPPAKLDDPSRWSTYKGAGTGYQAGTFDGKYVYFVRLADIDGADAGLTGSRILRYDTTAAAFDDSNAWASFDPEVALGTMGPHATAVMDGKYLLIGAYEDRIFLRYDTTQLESNFGFSSSWETFDGAGAGASASYNAVVTVDGGALFTNAGNLLPAVHRGDQLDAGWEVTALDASTFACPVTYTAGCTGTNAFFLPAGGDRSCVARYDTTKPLLDGFDSVDLATFGEDWLLLASGVVTPQHVYVTQFNTKDAAAPTQVLRKPIGGDLDAGWERQPTNVKNPLARGFIGGAFDGRFVYFAPFPAPAPTSFFERYDTTLGFNDPNAWDVAPSASVGVPSNRYRGAIFDGQYVYYASNDARGGEPAAFARFKAYDTKIAVPPACR